ncbi:cytochrome P450 [Xanthobacter dioxanivorans]|uniref:Cytochrome P450 n=1 Tax=Xanthobacter dioxanivorans TaxID=2528964 RepID=A0A974PT07_9HYPH|nr:cytochrome P450 [Xanthobacter dioxanivorans]QRG09165.1 cytochrome P450 [Xanthobacter dioxanivorans]
MSAATDAATRVSPTPYLDRLASLRPAERWPLARSWISSEPRAFFAELRAHAPIYETSDVTLIARRADVIEVLSIPKVFTVDLYKPKMGDFMLAMDETVVNYRDKSVMRAILAWEDLPKVRSTVAEVADEALDKAGCEIEAVQQLARLVPMRIVQRIFGIAGPDQDLLDWSYANQLDQFNNLPYDGRPDAEAVHQAAEEARVKLRALFAQLIPARIAEIKAGTAPDDSLTRILSLNLPAAAHFGMDRVVINIGGLLIGAIETTAEAVINALAELFARPEALAGARAAAVADDPAFEGYVWEALRFSPIVAFMFREAASTIAIAQGTDREKVIGKGTVVLPLSLSAMFDADFVPEPEAFKPDRPFHTYLHFGYGHHECLGRYVGGTMIPEIVKRVLRRPASRPLAPVDMGGTPFPQSYRIGLD